jgi:F0F1-type ATP synthase membrane subunit c/vacuolar-type H+-ATPase subunit K
MVGAGTGYASYMRIVREDPDDLRAEVGQSVVLLGLVAVIVVIGLLMGLAF